MKTFNAKTQSREGDAKSSSPREERVGRGPKRGAAFNNEPPLPGPLLHFPMEEKECSSLLGEILARKE